MQFSKNSINCLYYGTLHRVSLRQYGVDLSKMGLLPCWGAVHITKALYYTDLFLRKIRQQS